MVTDVLPTFDEPAACVRIVESMLMQGLVEEAGNERLAPSRLPGRQPRPSLDAACAWGSRR